MQSAIQDVSTQREQHRHGNALSPLPTHRDVIETKPVLAGIRPDKVTAARERIANGDGYETDDVENATAGALLNALAPTVTWTHRDVFRESRVKLDCQE